ncbi:MAG: hypothetical protein FJ318_05715 [SAR202 cluster bacterium]|nr:hypothetical protein [SAR202 cluster bacterium]
MLAVLQQAPGYTSPTGEPIGFSDVNIVAFCALITIGSFVIAGVQEWLKVKQRKHVEQVAVGRVQAILHGEEEPEGSVSDIPRVFQRVSRWSIWRIRE